MRKLVDKVSVTGKATVQGQTGIQPLPEQWGPITHKSDLGKQTPSIPIILPLHSFFPQLYMLSTMPYGMGYPVGQGRSDFPAVSLLCAPSLLAGE